jgi:rubrerythrin
MHAAVVARLDPNRESKAVAARAWARMAGCELASVESFERIAKQLQALDAPSELIACAKRFADDERRHAATILDLARRFDPAAEPEPVATQRALELEGLLEETILAGCIGETLTALEIEHMRAACSDDELAATLGTIAFEEARHAEYAWVVLAWLIRRFPALRSPAVQLFEQRGATVRLGLDHSLPEFGLLADDTRVDLWDVGRRHVVARLAARVLLLPPAPVERRNNLC